MGENKIVRNSERLQYVTLVIMLLLLFARNALQMNIPVLLFLVLSIIPILFGNTDNIIAIALSCIPMSTGFQYKYTLFFCILIYLFKKGWKLDISKSLIFVVTMMIWEFSHMFMGGFSLVEFLRCFAELLLLIIVIDMDLCEINYKMILRSLAISTIGICLIMLYIQLEKVGFNLQSLIGTSYHNYRFGAGTTVASNFGLNFNSNGLGFICNLTIVSMLTLYNKKEYTIYDVFLAVMAVLFGLMTLSRTFIVCLLFIIIGFVLGTVGSITKKAKSIFGLLFIALVCLLIVYTFLPETYNNLLFRFGEADLLNGRDTLLSFYFKHIFSSPLYLLFGLGLQDFQEKLSKIYGGYTQVCHNGFQEVWVVWGIVGVFLFFGLLLAIISDSKPYQEKHYFYQFVPLLLMLLYTSAGQLIRSELSMLSLTLIYLCLCIPDNHQDENGNN